MRALDIAAQLSSVLASITIVFAIFAYRREVRGQNLTGLFYLHQYLAQPRFADARRATRTRLAHLPFEEWTESDVDVAFDVALSFEEAALLLGGEVLNDKGRELMMSSYWGRSILEYYAILQDFMQAPMSATMTGAQYFPNFTALHEEALAVHGWA